jgi:hypothetical protein
MGLEVVSVGNFISTCLFMVTIHFFRQTSLLESLFEVTIAPPTTRVSTDPFAKSFGLGHADIADKKVLFEFDSSAKYEIHVKNFIDEALGHMESAILFTRKGSWIHSALGGHEGVRLFLLTPQISYPQQGDLETEMLLPSNDTSIIANALDKALKASPDRPVSIIYDNISEMLILLGMEKTYSFLTIALEILSRAETKAIFLINSRAHDAQIVSAIRGLFETQIVQEQASVKIAKAA